MTMPPETVAPTLALSSTMLPELGAFTVRSAARAFAWSRAAWADSTERWALETALCSEEVSVETGLPSSSIAGAFCALARAFFAAVRSSCAAARAR